MKRTLCVIGLLLGIILSTATCGQRLPMPAITPTQQPHKPPIVYKTDTASIQKSIGLDSDTPAPGAAAVGSGFVESVQSLPPPVRTPQATKHLSLKEAILLALRNNPDVESSELQRVEDKFALEVAHNAFVPQFSVTGSSNWATGQRPSYQMGPQVEMKTPIGTDIQATYGNAFKGQPGNVTLNLTQPILKGAGWAYNTAVLADAIDAEQTAKLTFKSSIITAVVNVINTYRTLVQDYNNLDVQRRTLLRAKQMVKQNELQVKAGKMAPSDVLQQKANLASNRLSFMQQKNSIDQDYQQFLQALGLVPSAKLTIDKRIDFHRAKMPSLKKSVDLALDNNIDYQSAVINLRSTRRALMSAKNQARWQLDFTASTTIGQKTGTATVPQTTGASTPGTIASPETGPSIGLKFTVPINDVKSKQAVLNARINLEKAQLARQQKKQQLIRDVTNQVLQVRNQYQQVLLGKETVKLQQQTLLNENIKLKYGKSTVFEANQLQDQLLQTQIQLISNKISFLNAITTLNQTLGITLDKWGITLRY